MQLRCRTCDKTIPAEYINIQLGIAKCVGCNAVFNFVEKLKGGGECIDVDIEKPAVGLPRQFRLDSWGPEVVITRRWYTHAVWPLLVFCIFWDGFLVEWYSTAIDGIIQGKGDWAMWLMIVFPLFHVAIGVGLSYIVISTFVNKTVIRVTSGELSVWHGPLPWGSNRQILTSDVKQVFCTRKPRQKNHDGSYTYSVEALRRDGSLMTLVSTLEELDQARFIEQQVEQHLKIRDERVAGEVRV